MLTSPFAWPEVRRGGERYLHELAAALCRAGHHVQILSSAPEAHENRVLGVPVRRFRRRRLRLDRWYRHLAPDVAFGVQALGAAATSQLDAWHAIGPADAAAATITSMLRPGVRSVYTNLGNPIATAWERRPDRSLHQFVVDHVDRYVCISENAADHLRRDFGRDPAVVSPGVDLSSFSPLPTRHRRPALLYAGHNEVARKDLPLLLKAVAILRRRHPDLELWLAGPGDPSHALEDAPSAASEAVTICELVDQARLRRLYAEAWATVLPAHDEAFGLVVVESLACGTPAVVRLDSGGPAEIVTNPSIGVRVPPTPESFAEGCEYAFDLACREETRSLCRDRAAAFDWDRVVVPRLVAHYGG